MPGEVRSRATFLIELADSFGVRLAGPDALIRAVVPQLLPQSVLDEIVAHYLEDARFYHHAWHLYDLFERAERMGLQLTREQQAALLFHDAVYLPGAPSGRNEASSARMLRQWAPRMAPLDVEAAAQFISDTSDHVARSPLSATVCDLDLAPLADDADRFALYGELVYLEYRPLLADPNAAAAPDSEQSSGAEDETRRRFAQQRGAFLVELARRPSIYSARMSYLEAPARRNIASYHALAETLRKDSTRSA